MNRFIPLLITLAGALVLWAAWPVSPLTLLIFIGWTPLLFIESKSTSWKKFLGYSLLHMFVWNALTTYWVGYASLGGSIGAFFVNALVMSAPWLLFYFTRRRAGNWIGYGSLIIYWLAMEHLHHNWDLSWPWLTLGNVFSTHPEWIQWYQYTGTAGGSLWVLIVNILAFSLFSYYRNKERGRPYFIVLTSLIITLALPLLLSRMIASRELKIANDNYKSADRNIVIVQPNIDPYLEKFSGSVESQIEKLIALSETQIDRKTRMVVWPETAIPAQVREDNIKEDYRYKPVWSFLKRHPFLSLLSGIDSYKEYGTDAHNASATARLHKPSGIYYDLFNTAALLESDSSIQLYHKAKLVPGVETLPSFLNFMGSWFEEFGGISGTLGRDSERKVFVPWDEYYKAAPIICYESIYSDYITEFVRRGANILVIITNDGWWENTPGYKQHMNYARLRAIETRKWVARSANTGISCFIDPMGNVLKAQPWDTEAAIKMNIPVSDRQTFYVKNGDILSRATIAVAIALMVWLLGDKLYHRFFRKK